jgi:hypothetical protein
LDIATNDIRPTIRLNGVNNFAQYLSPLKFSMISIKCCSDRRVLTDSIKNCGEISIWSNALSGSITYSSGPLLNMGLKNGVHIRKQLPNETKILIENPVRTIEGS